uniref:Ald_Xan_dh_C2 domain-containing protein n=1 Tax=Parastrongyloides trichosuri TaxID=131310 RepID=A0A0N4ZJH4_PARTI
MSEFALHARAILGLPVDVSMREPGASAVIYGGMEAAGVMFEGVAEALSVPTADLRLFGKPEAFERRRMGVALARGADTDEARARAAEAAGKVRARLRSKKGGRPQAVGPGGIFRHGQVQDGADFRRHRHIGGRSPRRHRPAPGREHQRRVDRGCGAVRLRHRLPLLRPLSGREGAGAERAQAHARRQTQRRPRLCADAPQRPVRPPFRGHRGRRPSGRACAGGADGLSARRAMDSGRRGAGGGGAGHDRPVHVDPPRRSVAGRHGPHRNGSDPRRHRPGRGADDHGHHPGGAGAGGGQGAGREPVGDLHCRRHHSHRHLHGAVHALSAARTHRRHRRPGHRHTDRAAARADARHHPLHRRDRAGLLGRPVPLPVHHHRLRGRVGLPRPDLIRHHAQAAGERGPDPADRLWRHAVRELRGDHGADRRHRAGPGRLFRHEQPGRRHRRQRGFGRRRRGPVGLPHHPGRTGTTGQGRGRALHPVARGRGADPGRRHGPHPVGRHRRQGHDGLLVSLRHSVRGPVHPDHSRRRHPRLPLHDPGSAGHGRAEDAPDPVVDRQCRGHGPDGRAVGLFPLYRRGRSAGRDQQPVAPVRHRQPDAGGGRPDPGHGRPVQDEAAEVRLGHGGPGGLAADLHRHGGTAEAVPPRREDRLPGPRAEVSGRHGRQRHPGPGQDHRRHAPRHRQRLRQLGADGGLPVRGADGRGLWRRRLPQGAAVRTTHRGRDARRA